MKTKMSCFICGLADEQLFSVDLSQTNDGKIIYSDLIQSFVKDQYEFAIFADDVVCQTCCVLLEELNEYQSKADEIKNLLMTQICRKYQVEANDTSQIYSLNEKHLDLFNLIPFVQKSKKYNCRKCSFTTEHADCLVPHYKWHESEEKVDVKQEFNVEHVYQCSYCEALLANRDLLKFHNRLFHAENGDEFEVLDAKLSIEYVDPAIMETQNECDAERVVEIDHLRCPLCEFCSHQSAGVQMHIRNVHAKRSFRRNRVRCQHCDTLFSNLTDIIEHSTAHPELIYKCCACEMVLIKIEYFP